MIFAILASCSSIPPADPSEPAVAPEYGLIVANYIKRGPLFPQSTYTDFEISDLRWVHAVTGWNWLTCVRFKDRGNSRIYSFFIENNAVIFSRYDVMTDSCAAQKYMPFDVGTGGIGPAAMSHWEPLH